MASHMQCMQKSYNTAVQVFVNVWQTKVALSRTHSSTEARTARIIMCQNLLLLDQASSSYRLRSLKHSLSVFPAQPNHGMYL